MKRTIKRTLKISALTTCLLFLSSCGLETYVVNTVHRDGSVTRTVTMKGDEKDIGPEDYRVPVDSTWEISYSYELKENQDTVWILEARKDFASVDEINAEYRNDRGSNSSLKREAHFSRQFRWFTTVYRYSENVERVLEVDSPISEFLSEEEVKFFYLPEKIQNELKEGKDSVRYESMSDQIEDKTEEWMLTALVRQFIGIFYDQAASDPGLDIPREEMDAKTGEIVKLLMDSGEDEDEEPSPELENMTEEELAVYADSVEMAESNAGDDELAELIIQTMGEDFYNRFKPELDSTESLLDSMAAPFWEADNYNMEVRMPGRIISSSGYGLTGPEDGEVTGVIWSVDGGYFLSQDYVMWVESRVNNPVLWIISALFMGFVVTGFILSARKKRSSE